ncbi:MAG: ATP-dependent helicase RhlE [Alphaproteobacteria bacterium]|nr:ATP-dependent helicase RhlE [Alphaproteobacteria bacterium]
MKDSALTAFLDLGLSEPIARALKDEQYLIPTPIQAQTIPQVLAARDVVGIAQTGTGKTAAFALPILNHLSKNRVRPERRCCRVLVLSPTRELSAQIVDSFRTYGRYLRPSVALAIGGVNIGPQKRALDHGVDVLVATPGRLLDLMQNRAIQLDRVEVFVLDEADRMLDMGFIHDIRRIVGKLPAQRQTLFFSATMPKEIVDLAHGMLRDPVRVSVTPAATTVEKVEQRIMHVDRAGKPALLAEILRQEPIDRVLVFTRTKHGADKVVRALAKSGLAAEAIHGNKSQNQRERVLAAFRAGKLRTLIATDIAARGIDVDGISHVVNYDLPNIAESYVHRIGRTARAGATGVAISFCDGEERAFLRDIEKLIRMSIPATDRRTDQRQELRAEDASAPPQQRRARPQQQRGRHQGQGRPSQQPQNGKPQRHYGRSQQRHHEPREVPVAATDGSIATVAFMQPKQQHRPHAGAPRRAPR